MDLIGEDSEVSIAQLQSTVTLNMDNTEKKPFHSFQASHSHFNPKQRYFDQKQCDFCGGGHESHLCDYRERRNSCFYCGEASHQVYQCQLDTCIYCGQKHSFCGNHAALPKRYQQHCFRCGGAHYSFTCDVQNQNNKQIQQKKRFCVYCGTGTHNVIDCMSANRNQLRFSAKQRSEVMKKMGLNRYTAKF